MATENEKVLAEAQKLYNEGKWPESNLLIDGLTIAEDEEMAEARRLRGWNYYYIGTKGLDDKQASLGRSKAAFQYALSITSDKKKKISIMNGLPLTFWVLGEQEWAWHLSDRAIEEFPDEPSVWNTRSILFRWAKDFKGSVEVCEQVYEKAMLKDDYRTAGNAKQNKADALKELGQINQARDEYASAIGLYKTFGERTGQSAQFHIDGVSKKMLALGALPEE
ncbi:MAG: hypothetical protein UV65_C0031G0014 [Parcubacteria group bacterium GW2011_GWF2_43_11]|nr:MAG: hypothetical protein UV65_C0031G0014 [Parcubacteria group bacterium GW2011_GWF2_43_11]